MTTNPGTNESRVNWRMLLLILGSFLPLMYWHVSTLLQKTHYQFLLLFPVAVWLLVSSLPKLPAIAQLQRWEAMFGTLGILIGLCALLVSSWVWSPWIAMVACWTAVGGWLFAVGGWALYKHWLPVLVFSLVLIPLPFGLDQDLIVGLRGYTTRMSSSVLDQFGVLHNMYANVIELPGKPLFIADACSGIHSLFVLMAAALFLCCWGRRGIVHSVLLLMSTFGLVLIENVARIVAVAMAWGRGWDWSEGTNHEVLGIVLFGVSLFLILTTDQLLMFFFPPDAPGLATRLQVIRSGSTGGNSYLDNAVPRKRVVATAFSQQIVKYLVFLFPIMLLLQAVRLPGMPPSLLNLVGQEFELPALGKDALPAEVEGFSVVEYEVVDRVAEDPFGQASQQWQLRKGALHCLFSIDYPYPGPHDLTECYANIGWTVKKRAIQNPEDVASSEVSSPLAVARLNRNLYGNAMLMFSHVDRDGKTEPMIFRDDAKGTADTRLRRRWTSFLERNSENKDSGEKAPLNGPYLQFQLLVRSPQELTEPQEKELVSLFQQLRSVLSKKVVSVPSVMN